LEIETTTRETEPEAHPEERATQLRLEGGLRKGGIVRRCLVAVVAVALIASGSAFASIKVEPTAGGSGSEQILKDALKRIQELPLGKALLQALDDNKCEVTIRFVSNADWQKEKRSEAKGLTKPSADGKKSTIIFPDPLDGLNDEEKAFALKQLGRATDQQASMDGWLIHELLHALIHCVAPGLTEAEHHQLMGSTGKESWSLTEPSGFVEGGLLEKFFQQLGLRARHELPTDEKEREKADKQAKQEIDKLIKDAQKAAKSKPKGK
jgi:hypothetical protein